MKDEHDLNIFFYVIIGSLILIILCLALFININSFSIETIFINGKIFGLSDGFWGALFGALITGLMAIKVSNGEHKRRIADKDADSKKVLLVLKEYAEDLRSDTVKIFDVYNKAKDVFDPYQYIEFEYDEEGREHVINFPPPQIEDEYAENIKPYKNELLKLSKNIQSLIEEIQKIDIQQLDIDSYKDVLAFKQNSRKIIEPWIEYTHSIGGSINTFEEFEVIEKMISDFYDSVS
ncbi:hypothetical protein NCCP2222_19000 [Sporosarcina sp. NCCP-2222]|uniref:hypothetical protein n=1 Tax=Sporosarcina sp. NCCP-2222 TaxID=2935073 RepID=UPI002084DF1D|nr:hypothetical protein [Sporosarcina sp. NCCP-2222]GKV55953.1 hypothetical protein NCCP2222_19000 [Sporosarcina sp. NCCP-2222]